MSKQAETKWRAVSYAAGRGRAVVRHWVLGPEGVRMGHYPSAKAAQDEADKRNAQAAALAA